MLSYFFIRLPRAFRSRFLVSFCSCFCLVLCLLGHLASPAQTGVCGPATLNYTPFEDTSYAANMMPLKSIGGHFNHLYDRFGNRYPIEALRVSPPIGNAPSDSCVAGFFVFYYTANSGFAGNSAFAVNARATVCQVGTALSGFINPGFNPNLNNTRVRILVDDLANFSTSPNVLGVASGYYAFPLNPNNPNGGIADNQVYKTITTQQDAYNGIAMPLMTNGGSGFYHGFMAYNFSNPAFVWNVLPGLQLATSSQLDLYTVVLHELTHTLGFASLIASNGNSAFGSLNNYYARYDLRLRDAAGNPLLAQGSLCTNFYNLSFTNTPSVMGFSNCISVPTNSTNCANAVRYVSTALPNMPIYTPICFENGSTLSHFEDQCYPPPPNAFGNDLYFTMSNANGIGINKRFLREEERLALCDMGYPVNTSIVSGAISASTVYVGACNTPQVWGINDGLGANNSFIYSGAGPLSIPIAGLNGLITNDSPNTVSVSCVEDVFNVGTAAVVGGNVVFTPTLAGFNGAVLLRYIPRDVAGNGGNVTYVYGYITSPTCAITSGCDMVPNNGFEINQNCGSYNVPTVLAQCWKDYIYTPDLFVRNCTFTTAAVPSLANLGISTYGTLPVLDSHNGSPNDAIMGLWGRQSVTAVSGVQYDTEAAYINLATPLVPGQVYQLNLRVFNYSGPFNNWTSGTLAINPTGLPIVFALATSQGFAPVGNTFFPSSGALTVIQTVTTNAGAANTWQNYNVTFTYNPVGLNAGTNGNFLYIGIHAVQTGQLMVNNLGFNAVNQFFYNYVGVDDISIMPVLQLPSFQLPLVCPAPVSYTNLGQYLGAVSSASFSGPGVSQVGNQFNFNVPPSLPSGVYTVVCTYTAVNSCSYTTAQAVYLPTVGVINPSLGCSSNNYTFAAQHFSPSTTYTWLPMNVNTPSVVVSPSTTLTFTLTTATGSCVQTFTFMVTPQPSLSAAPAVCLGSAQPFILNNLVLPSYSLSSGFFSGPGISAVPCAAPNGTCFGINLAPGPLTAGIYTFSYSAPASTLTGLVCPVLQSFTVQLWPSFTVSAVALGNGGCLVSGQTGTLLANVSPNVAGISYTWQPGGTVAPALVVSPLVNTVYTVTGGVGGGACSSSGVYSLGVNPAITFSQIPSTLCTFASYFNLTALWLGAGTPTNGTWTASAGLSSISQPSPGIYNLSINPNLSTLGTHTLTYSYASVFNPTCVVSQSFTTTLAQGFGLNVSAGQTYCSNIPGASVVISATGAPVPPGGIIYVWQPGGLTGASATVSPSSTTVYTVTAVSGACGFSMTSQVDTRTNCCVAANYINTGTLVTNINGGSYAINQDVTIASNVFLMNAEFLVAPNVKINVLPNVLLTVSNTHFYACTDMWKGIEVQTNGKLNLTRSNIEDANTAVKFNGATSVTPNANDLLIVDCVFNRNLTGVHLLNYTQNIATAPFKLEGNAFTCRVLPFTSTTWVSSASNGIGLRALVGSSVTLVSPYTMQNYALANLKAPLSSMKSSLGVFVENVGTVQSFTTNPPVYTSVLIGNEVLSNRAMAFNLFDNLYYGIYAKNGNVKSAANTFQNMTRNSFTSGGGQQVVYGGYGIYATHDSIALTNNYLSITHSLSATTPNLGNWFYECYAGVGLSSILTADIQYGEFRSSQTFLNAPTNTLNLSGQVAITAYGNRSMGYKLDNNAIRNHENGIRYHSSFGSLSIPALFGMTFGRYVLDVSIKNNEITPNVSIPANPSAFRTGLGVYASALPINGTDLAIGSIKIEQNKIIRAFRGVEVTDWKHSTYIAAVLNNTVSLVNDFINPTLPQYGIKASNCIKNRIVSNSVSGANVTNTVITSIVNSLNQQPFVECNVVSNTFAGFEFAGANPNTYWRNNTMTNNRRGFYLTNAAVLGTMGNISTPTDNRWNGTWTGNSGTYGEQNFIPIQSQLFVRAGSPFYPPFNNGFSGANAYNISALPTVTNNPGSLNCTSGGSGGGGGGGGGSGAAAAAQINLLNDIATDSITYSVNVAESEEINKNMLFEQLVNTPTLSAASAILNSFFISNQSAVRGLYHSVIDELSQGNWQTADAILSNFNPNTNIEQNYKVYFELSRKYYSQTPLSAQDKLNLLILSHQCPFIDGTVVYEARALLNYVTQSAYQFNDNDCATQGFSYGRTNGALGSDSSQLVKALEQNEKLSKQKFNTVASYVLFPNPAQEEVSIYGFNTLGETKIEIKDVNGKKLAEQSIVIKPEGSKLKLNLINGIYFVNLIDSSSKRTVKKLVIAK